MGSVLSIKVRAVDHGVNPPSGERDGDERTDDDECVDHCVPRGVSGKAAGLQDAEYEGTWKAHRTPKA